MAVFSVVTPPAPVVTWDEAAAHIKWTSPDEKAYIERLIAAATASLDGPAGWLGQALGEQTIEVRLDEFCSPILLPCPPIISVAGIYYTDRTDAEQTVDAATYRQIGRTVFLRSGQSWPSSVSADPGAVRLRYVAGYPIVDGKSTVPEPIKQAILLLARHWHANREAVVVGTIVTELPFGVEALLTPFRVWA